MRKYFCDRCENHIIAYSEDMHVAVIPRVVLDGRRKGEPDTSSTKDLCVGCIYWLEKWIDGEVYFSVKDPTDN